MQCGLNLTTKHLNNRLPEIMPSWITESMMQGEDTSQEDEPPSTIHRGSTMMSNRLLEGGREPTKQKEMINNEETIAKYIEAKRQVKRIVQQEKALQEL